MRRPAESGIWGTRGRNRTDIAREGVGHVLTASGTKVIPHSLPVGEPEDHAHAHEDQEKPNVKSRAAREKGIGTGRMAVATRRRLIKMRSLANVRARLCDTEDAARLGSTSATSRESQNLVSCGQGQTTPGSILERDVGLRGLLE